MKDRPRIVFRSLVLGLGFGFILVRSEVVSWYRIQEMFRLQGFHMYGIIGSAVLVGMLSLWIIRAWACGARTASGLRSHPS